MFHAKAQVQQGDKKLKDTITQTYSFINICVSEVPTLSSFPPVVGCACVVLRVAGLTHKQGSGVTLQLPFCGYSHDGWCSCLKQQLFYFCFVCAHLLLFSQASQLMVFSSLPKAEPFWVCFRVIWFYLSRHACLLKCRININ